MKKHNMLLLCFSLFVILMPRFARAAVQDSILAPPAFVKIKLENGGSVKGYILDITDSSAVIVPKNEWNNGVYDTTIVIPAQNIAIISGRKRGAVSKLGGAAGGFVAGSLIGIGLSYKIRENNSTTSDDDGFFSSQGLREGLYAGAALGSIGLITGFLSQGKHKSKRYKINGSRLKLMYWRFEILSQ